MNTYLIRDLSHLSLHANYISGGIPVSWALVVQDYDLDEKKTTPIAISCQNTKQYLTISKRTDGNYDLTVATIGGSLNNIVTIEHEDVAYSFRKGSDGGTHLEINGWDDVVILLQGPPETPFNVSILVEPIPNSEKSKHTVASFVV